MENDNRGNRIEESYFGTDGKPCLNKDGFAKLTMEYSEKGECVEVIYYDEKGNIIEK
jgi:hypothetical protein